MKSPTILQLLYPESCIICEEPGNDFCRSCATRLRPVVVSRQIEDITFVAGAIYDDDLAKIILLAKESNSGSARRILTSFLYEAFLGSGTGITAPISFVPIPSRKAANRVRGYKHATLLSRALSQQITRNLSIKTDVVDQLRVNRRILDQSNLGRGERIQNLASAYSWGDRAGLRRNGPEGQSKTWILVDDLVTTGTTMREGVRAMRAAGLNPMTVLSAGIADRSMSHAGLPNKIRL
jgi:predicted amidophosphoribosyltransferase